MISKLWKIYSGYSFGLKIGIGALVVLFALIVFGLIYSACSDEPTPQLNETEIQNQTSNMANRETERLNQSVNRGNQVEANVDERSRQAEENTRQSTNQDYSNMSLEDIKQQTKKRLKR